jgi:hypothetical protein
MTPLAYVGPIRATLRLDGRYQDYYVRPEEAEAVLWPVVVPVPVTPLNDPTY